MAGFNNGGDIFYKGYAIKVVISDDAERFVVPAKISYDTGRVLEQREFKDLGAARAFVDGLSSGVLV